MIMMHMYTIHHILPFFRKRKKHKIYLKNKEDISSNQSAKHKQKQSKQKKMKKWIMKIFDTLF